MRKTENIAFIGSGTMGRLFGGEEAVSLRFTADFREALKDKKLVFLGGRQQAGLEWLRGNSQLLSGKLVVSIMAFTDFEALELAAANDQTRFVRVMTDTSLRQISWSDDGRLTDQEKLFVASWLSGYGQEEYLGVRNDEALLQETIKACHLGWVAQALTEITDFYGEDTLIKVLEQRQKGFSFDQITMNVATENGATEAGIFKTAGKFVEVAEKQQETGQERAKQKSEFLVNFAKQLV